MPLASDIPDIIKLVEELTDLQRVALLTELRKIMCIECGRMDPRCQCWNDD